MKAVVFEKYGPQEVRRLDRVNTRDQSIHINVSDDHAMNIDKQVREKQLGMDFAVSMKTKPQRS